MRAVLPQVFKIIRHDAAPSEARRILMDQGGGERTKKLIIIMLVCRSSNILYFSSSSKLASLAHLMLWSVFPRPISSASIPFRPRSWRWIIQFRPSIWYCFIVPKTIVEGWVRRDTERISPDSSSGSEKRNEERGG